NAQDAGRRSAARGQAPGTGQTHTEPDLQPVDGARYAYAERIRPVPECLRQSLGVPVAAIPPARLPAREQEYVTAERLQAPGNLARAIEAGAARARNFRHLPHVPRAKRLPRA